MTLLEITVVLVIVAVMLGVVLPNFGPLRMKGQLRTSTRNLAALIRYARSAAIYGHRLVELRLDVGTHRYRLDLLTDDKLASERDEDEVELVEAIRELPDSVMFDRVILYSGEGKPRDNIVVLQFTPRGNVTPATIILADTKGRRMTIDVFRVTGAVEVYRGQPEDYEVQGESAT